ncbi:MAG TPA: hypothetical protein VFR84_04080 [Candidatus Angelobacter sp.]|nr:hypothetical protein [Candidatus Angelobacter sp.]
MPVDYLQLLLDLLEERQQWLGKRDQAVREISRLSELIRATMKMVPPGQLARYEPVFARIEQRPAGLSLAIRACFTAGPSPFHGLLGQSTMASTKGETPNHRSPDPPITRSPDPEGWLTPVQIRDRLKDMGFPFENYKANPLASIHTSLKRMVPAEMEVKTLDNGQKVYRLKSAGEWSQAFAEIRQWLHSDLQFVKSAGSVVAVRLTEDSEQRKEK